MEQKLAQDLARSAPPWRVWLLLQAGCSTVKVQGGCCKPSCSFIAGKINRGPGLKKVLSTVKRVLFSQLTHCFRNNSLRGCSPGSLAHRRAHSNTRPLSHVRILISPLSPSSFPLGQISHKFPAGRCFLCTAVLTLFLAGGWNQPPSSPAPLPVLYHSSLQRAPSKHPARHPSLVQMTIFSRSTAILEFVADWLLLLLLLGVWAVISSGMSGLLSNHSRVPGQGGWLGALITTPPAVARTFSLFYK